MRKIFFFLVLFGSIFFGQTTLAACEGLEWEAKEDCKYTECMSDCTLSNCPWWQCDEVNSDYCFCKCDWWVTLNTNIPFVGRCILLGDSDSTWPNSTQVTQLSAFPRLMKALTNIALSLILVTSLIMIIAWWVMIASSGANSGGYDQGKKLIRKVVIGLILLGASGIILALINPNFFG